MNNRTLSAIRRYAGHYLTDTCDLLSAGTGVDEYGYPTHEQGVTRENVPCRAMPLAAADANGVIGGQETLKGAYRLALPHDTSITVGDQVRYNGRVYEVRALSDNVTDQVFVSVQIVEVQRG